MTGNHLQRGRFEIRHAAARTNSFELWIGGRKVTVAGKRKIMEELL
jgi:hypothetical protein